MTYAEAFAEAQRGYAGWLWRDVTHPGWGSYFTLLVAVSAVFLLWEQVAPWRAQPRIREGFWLDGFYLFFNFFLFSLLGFQAVAAVSSAMFQDALAAIGVTDLALLRVDGWPTWSQLVLYLVVRDFAQFWIHRLLHRVPLLWRFHRVHHSVRQMGFAANLRFHFAETVVYRTLEFVPLALIGFGAQELFAVHAFGVLIGHWNHANIRLPLGPLRFVLNHPQMHIWHHAKDMPPGYGRNFGVTLSAWDYLFGTAWTPGEGRDHALGFEGVERYPRGWWAQTVEPLRRDGAAQATDPT